MQPFAIAQLVLVLEKMLRRRWAQRPGLAKTTRPPISVPAAFAMLIHPTPFHQPLAPLYYHALLGSTVLSIIGLCLFIIPDTPILVTAPRIRRGRPSPALVWILCRSLVRTNQSMQVWEVFIDEGILFRVLNTSERTAEGVAGAFAVLDGHSRSSVALRVVIIFRIGDAPERLVRRRDRDRAQ